MKSFIKRTLAAILSLLLIVSLFPAPAVAWAEEPEVQEQSGTAAAQPVTFEIEAPQEEHEHNHTHEAQPEEQEPVISPEPAAEPEQEQPEASAPEAEQEEPAQEQPQEEQTEEATQEETAEEATEEETTEEETQEEIVLEYRSLTEADVTVSGLIPADASLSVIQLSPESYEQLAGKGRAVVFAYDISIISAGCEWQPVEPLSVKISAPAEAGEEMEILHIEDGNLKPQLVAEVQAHEVSGELEFTASGFSVYIGTVSDPAVLLQGSEAYAFYYDPECTCSVSGELILDNESQSDLQLYLRAKDGYEITDVYVLAESGADSTAQVLAGEEEDIFDFSLSFPWDLQENQIITVEVQEKESEGLYWLVYDEDGDISLFISSLPICEDDYDNPLESGAGFSWNSSSYYADIYAVYTGGQTSEDIVRPLTTSCWFKDMGNLSYADLEGLDTSNVTDMSYMFYNCGCLEELYGLESWNTANVKNFSHMFESVNGISGAISVGSWCTDSAEDLSYMFAFSCNISEIDVSGWNTSNVRNMAHMFDCVCCNLTELDVSGWDTSNVVNMQGLFWDAGCLEAIDVSGWDTSNVTDMSYLFSDLYCITELDVSGFDTSNVVNMECMFQCLNCLESLDVLALDTSKVTNMAYMFEGCCELTELDISGFNTANVVSMESMFCNCNSLTELDLSGFDTAKVTNMCNMFAGCGIEDFSFIADLNTANVTDMLGMLSGTGITSFSFAGLNTAHVSNMGHFFSNCNNLQSVDFAGINTVSLRDMGYMFYNCKSLADIDLRGLNTANVTNMNYMFYGCSSLAFVDLSSLNTARVTDMASMFDGCTSLSGVNLSGLNTSNVKYFYNMFQGCASLTSIDLSQLNTQSAIDIDSMFVGCTSLVAADLSGWQLPNATGFRDMFWNCSKLKSVNLSNWYAPQLSYPDDMFTNCSSLEYFDIHGSDFSGMTFNGTRYGFNFSSSRSTLKYVDMSDVNFASAKSFSSRFSSCTKLETVKLSGMYAPKATSLSSMFSGCSQLKTLDMSNADLSSASDISSLFSGCSQLETPNLTGIVATNITNMVNMFYNCYNLRSLDLSGFDTASVTNMGSMFSGCYALKSLDLSSFNPANVTNMQNMFLNCYALESLDLSGFNTSSAVNMVNMFCNCNSLQSLDLSSFNTANVTNMGSMFSNCYALVSLDLSNFSTLSVTTMSSMFSGCRSLQSLDLSSFNTANVTNLGSIFRDCSALKSLDLSSFNPANVTNMQNMFLNCYSLESLDLSGFNTSSAVNMANMFYNCNSLQSLDLSSFNTSNVTNMGSMFYNCNSLQSLDLSSFNTSNVTNMGSMFRSCRSLQSLDLSSFNTVNVTNVGYMFQECYVLESLDLSGWQLPKLKSCDFLLDWCNNLKNLDMSGWYAPELTDCRAIFNVCSRLETVNLQGADLRSLAYTNSNNKLEFSNRSSIKHINMKGVNLSSAQNLSSMFYNCRSLKSLDFSEVDASNVTNMSSMFYNCSSLQSLDFSDVDASNVTNMSQMFYCCSSLQSLDFSGVDTSSATTMAQMFINCSSLESLDLSGVDTSSVTNMGYMFQNCSALESLDLSSFNTSNVTNMSIMFCNCSSLRSLDLSDIDTSSVTNMGFMFQNCSALESLDLSSFNTSKVTSMTKMFFCCNTLRNLDLSSFNTAAVTDMSYMFYGCRNLTDVDVSGFNTAAVTNMGYMFESCSKLVYLDVSGFNTSAVKNMSNMFANCSKVTNLDVTGFNTAVVTNMSYMFYGCSSLTGLDVSGFDTSAVTTMSYMFQGCNKLTNLDVTGFNTSKVTDMSYMFQNCTALTYLDVSGFNTSAVRDMSFMFQGCNKLTNLDVTGFDTSRVTSMYYMFNNCGNLSYLDVSGFDTASVTNMSNMFSFCSKLSYLDVSGFNTSKVTSMSYMFYACNSLSYLDVSGFDTSAVVYMTYMFCSCKLRIIDVSSWNTAKVKDIADIFSYNPVTVLDLSGWNLDNVASTNIKKGLTNLCKVELSASAAAKLGQYFNGWSDENGNTCNPIPTDRAGTYYPTSQYVDQPYCTYFDANAGGDTVSNMPELSWASKVSLCDYAPKREGYTFLCWNTEPDRSGTDYYTTDTYSSVLYGSTLYAVWAEREEISLSYSGNGGARPSGEASFDYSIGKQEYVRIKINSFNKAGCTFLYWEDEDGNQYLPGSYANFEADTVLNAVWAKNPLISFNPNGGQGSAVYVAVAYGGSYYIGDMPFTKEGYELYGWSIDPDCSPDDSTSRISRHDTIYCKADTEYFAVWKEKISFTFHSNLEPDQTLVMSFNSYDEAPSNPFNINDKVLYYWCTNPNGSNLDNERWVENDYHWHAEDYTDATDFYAIWYENPVITYHRNAPGMEDSTFTVEELYGSPEELPEMDITVAGYSFHGWSTSADSVENRRNPGNTRGAATEYYAVWKKDVTINYHINISGRDDTQSVTIAYGSEHEFLPCSWDNGAESPFLYWNTEPDGQGCEYLPEDSDCFYEDTDLYAIWYEAPVITFHNNTGELMSGSFTEKILYDESYRLPLQAGTLNPGSTFIGWNTEPDGSGTQYAPGVAYPGGTEFYACWKENPEITYHINISGQTQSFTRRVPYAAAGMVETCPWDNGEFEFLWWNTEPDDSGTVYFPNNSIGFTEDTELYAIWQKEITVTFHNNIPGEEDQSFSIVRLSHTSYFFPACPYVRDGFFFNGWSETPDCSTRYWTYDESISFAEDTDLYACWYNDGYLISYIFNRGEYDNGLNEFYMETYWYEEGDEATIYNTEQVGFRYPDHSFLEWNTEPDGSGDTYSVGETFDVSDNLNIYAIWARNSFNITFHSNFDQDQTVSQAVPYHSWGFVKASPWQREGYAFAHWNTEPDGSGTDYLSGASLYGSCDFELYAQWGREVEICFLSNNDNEDESYQYVPADCDTRLDCCGFDYPGYTFAGWNTEPDGSGTSYGDGELVNLTEDTTLHAQWTDAFYYVYFQYGSYDYDAEICGYMGTQIMYCNTEYNLNPLSFTRTGYAFVGWEDEDGNLYEDKAAVENLALEQGAQVYLTATWREAPSYQVTIPAVIEIESLDGESGELQLKLLIVNFTADDSMKLSLNYSGQLSYSQGGELVETLNYTICDSVGNSFTPGSSSTLKTLVSDSTGYKYTIIGIKAQLDQGETPHYAGTYSDSATFTVDMTIAG